MYYYNLCKRYLRNYDFDLSFKESNDFFDFLQRLNIYNSDGIKKYIAKIDYIRGKL